MSSEDSGATTAAAAKTAETAAAVAAASATTNPATVALANLFAVQVVAGIPAGFKNLGATCYLNSLLQALRACKYFHSSVMVHARVLPRVKVADALTALCNLLKRNPESKVTNRQSDPDKRHSVWRTRTGG